MKIDNEIMIIKNVFIDTVSPLVELNIRYILRRDARRTHGSYNPQTVD
jgi:hypothetical protein